MSPVRTHALAANLLLAATLLGCPPPEEDSAATEPVETVVLITIDALSPRILWGNGGEWETAPQLRGLFHESTVL